VIYLDNAATTYPKPAAVLEAMTASYTALGVSPGRGSYDLAVEAEAFIDRTRRKLADLFNAPDPDRVIFAANATDGLNILFNGLLQPGDHVVSTRLEHNSVLRPLHHLRQGRGIAFSLVPFDAQGFIDPEDVARAIRPETRLVAVNHASNVLGTVQPVAEVGAICAARGVPLLVDASQSAGQVAVDMAALQASAIAFTGHKSLYGPTGIGGVILSPDLDVRATRFGGTGVDSRSPEHTPGFPHRLEAGTLNVMGIMGLSAAVDFIQDRGLPAIHAQEMGLLGRLQEGLAEIRGVTLYGTRQLDRRTAVLTLNVEGMAPSDVGAILDADFDIAVRVGLHCAPLVHETLGTAEQGAVRFSLGVFNTESDIDRAIAAMARIAAT
jgi:cysteine desulfurase family protein